MKTVLRALMIVLPALAVCFTAVPGSYCMRFFAGENGYFYEYVSGFDPILMGYGNFGPMIAGVLSVVVAVVGLLRWKKPYWAHTGILAVAGFCASLINLGCDQTVWNWMIYGVLLGAVVVDRLLKFLGKKKGSAAA